MSDPLCITAQPLEILTRTKETEDLIRLKEIIQEYDVQKIVIGLPLNMDGSEGFMVASMRAFARALTAVIPIEMIEVDERLTSHQAALAINKVSKKGKKKKKNIDSISAQIILQTYLDSISN